MLVLLSDTDIIAAQHFWTGGLETAGPGCYDAVAIGRAAGFRMLVMSRIRQAAIVPLAYVSMVEDPALRPVTIARSWPKRAAKISRKILAGQQSLSGWWKR
jgi:hypothetical protein